MTIDDAGCTVYASWPQFQSYGRYINDDAERATGSIRDRNPATADDGGYSVLNFEYFYVFNQPVPLQRIYDGGVTYADCDFCTTMFRGCRADGGACFGGFFLAQQGTVNAGRVGGRDGGGVFTANGTGLKFVEWEYELTNSTFVDRPKDGGSCIVVGSAAVDAGID